eukprot:11157557-Lingulodinium_polyedra.AAC.1
MVPNIAWVADLARQPKTAAGERVEHHHVVPLWQIMPNPNWQAIGNRLQTRHLRLGHGTWPEGAEPRPVPLCP